MSLNGSTNAEKIWNYLVGQGLTENGAAGLMGNLRAESGLKPTNLQNSFEKKLGLNDDTYTAAVDSGAYTNFVRDSAGYGLAQWTFWSRKQNLLAFAQKRAESIGDLEMQLDFLMSELSGGYKGVLATLMDGGKTVRECSDAVLLQFERPADQSEAVRKKRAEYAQEYFDTFSGAKNTKIGQNDTVSDKKSSETAKNGNTDLIIQSVDFGSNKSNPRTEKVSKITIHHMAGNLGAVQCAKSHLTGNRSASANYYIGSDGAICSGVAENRRAWTSSSSWNDHRAITIEVANDSGDPDWTVSEQAYQSLIRLCADICRRYGITPRYDGTKNGTLTEHRMYSATLCPGPYLHKLLESGKIASDIVGAMAGGKVTASVTSGSNVSGNVNNNATTNYGIPTYQVGKKYTLQVELRVRTGPGTNYPAKSHSGLTVDGQKHDLDKDGALDKGTVITCQQISKVGSDIWIKVPSGWLAAYYQGNVYIK